MLQLMWTFGLKAAPITRIFWQVSTLQLVLHKLFKLNLKELTGVTWLSYNYGINHSTEFSELFESEYIETLQDVCPVAPQNLFDLPS